MAEGAAAGGARRRLPVRAKSWKRLSAEADCWAVLLHLPPLDLLPNPPDLLADPRLTVVAPGQAVEAGIQHRTQVGQRLWRVVPVLREAASPIARSAWSSIEALGEATDLLQRCLWGRDRRGSQGLVGDKHATHVCTSSRRTSSSVAAAYGRLNS